MGYKMKKFIISIIVILLVIIALGGVFFLIDKAEYFSRGETIFTIDENMGEGLTRKVGLGYIMYTRNTGFPKNDNDNIITSWFNPINRDEAIEILLGEDIGFENLNIEENQRVKYYSYLIMTSLNSESEKFKIEDTKAILINFSSLEDLKTGEKISKHEIEAIKELLDQKLNNPDIKIENSNIEDVERDKKIQSVLVQGIVDGIYIDIRRIDSKAKVEVEIVKKETEFLKSNITEKAMIKYSFDLDLIKDSRDGNIFTAIKED